MGKLEEQSRRRTRRSNLQKYILRSVAAVGILSAALLAPNVIGAMVKTGLLPLKRQRELIETSRKRLIQRGLLAYRNGSLKLTPAGEAALRKLELIDYQFKKPKQWDHKWRILIFDIPEYRRKVRLQIRITLSRIGFIRLQDSVWIFPYDCEDLLTLLKSDFHVGKDMLYMVVDSLENDAPVRKAFGL